MDAGSHKLLASTLIKKELFVLTGPQKSSPPRSIVAVADTVWGLFPGPCCPSCWSRPKLASRCSSCALREMYASIFQWKLTSRLLFFGGSKPRCCRASSRRAARTRHACVHPAKPVACRCMAGMPRELKNLKLVLPSPKFTAIWREGFFWLSQFRRCGVTSAIASFSLSFLLLSTSGFRPEAASRALVFRSSWGPVCVLVSGVMLDSEETQLTDA